MTRVLDASALIAFLADEVGAESVQSLLLAPDTQCYAHAVNLCEVYYQAARRGGTADAQAVLDKLQVAGVMPRTDIDEAFWHSVGDLKARLIRVSLADCFGLALAMRVEGELVTSDHHEFDRVAELEIHPIQFIR